MNSLSVLRIENDVLIPLVEKRPVLWDTTLEVPKRKKAKRKAWKNISRELFEDFDGMDDEDKDEYLNGVKKRWQCLQDTFLKKKGEEVLNKSGPGLKKYIYAQKVQFLDKIYNLVQSPSKINCSMEVSDEKSTSEPSQSKITKKLVSLTEQNKTRKNLKSNNSKSHECGFSESSKCVLDGEEKSSEPASSKVRDLDLRKGKTVKHNTSKKSKDIKSKGLSTKAPKHRTSKKRHNNTSTDGQFVAKKLCKKASSEKLSKTGLVDELFEDKSTPKSFSREIFISKPLEDRLCKNKPVDQFPKGKSFEDQPFKCNVTDHLSKNKFTSKPSKERSADKPLTNNLTDEPPKYVFASKPSDRLSEQPSILEVEDLMFQTDAIEQTKGRPQGGKHEVGKHFGTQKLRPERMHTFNLLIQSVMPHLNKFDKSEILEFQMGVLQVIRDINNSREGPPTLIPEQVLDPITPSTSESWS